MLGHGERTYPSTAKPQSRHLTRVYDSVVKIFQLPTTSRQIEMSRQLNSMDLHEQTMRWGGVSWGWVQVWVRGSVIKSHRVCAGGWCRPSARSDGRDGWDWRQVGWGGEKWWVGVSWSGEGWCWGLVMWGSVESGAGVGHGALGNGVAGEPSGLGEPGAADETCGSTSTCPLRQRRCCPRIILAANAFVSAP